MLGKSSIIGGAYSTKVAPVTALERGCLSYEVSQISKDLEPTNQCYMVSQSSGRDPIILPELCKEHIQRAIQTADNERTQPVRARTAARARVSRLLAPSRAQTRGQTELGFASSSQSNRSEIAGKRGAIFENVERPQGQGYRDFWRHHVSKREVKLSSVSRHLLSQTVRKLLENEVQYLKNLQKGCKELQDPANNLILSTVPSSIPSWLELRKARIGFIRAGYDLTRPLRPISHTHRWGPNGIDRDIILSALGSNMTVYGTFQWVQSGSFDLVAYVDDGPPLTQTFSGIPHSGWQPHFPLFSTGNLDPGQHTVTVELSKCVNQTLVFDYILYTPSFSTLASMPSMTPRITSTKKPAVSVIIGSVIGGLVLLGLFCLFFIWRKRIQKRRARDTLPAYMESMALKPFPGGASRDKSTCTDTKKI
ncbi:hypothetical protein C8J56DRAFT_896715 [Mycena floridula]|nr:hypothetical protein C8J56DRAFT_896715 [Mycena floridula]